LKNRQNYEKLMKESDLAKDAFIKAEKDEINQPEKKNLQAVTKKASQNYNQITEKAKAAEGLYKSSTQKTNEDIDSFKKDKMPSVLEQFQKYEEDRWATLLNVVKTFKGFEENLPSSYEKYSKDLETAIDAADMHADFKELVETFKKDKEEEKVEFVQFKSKHEAEPEKPKSTPEESTFATQTAEEKLQKKDQKEETKEADQPDKSKKEEQKKKTQETKANLFDDSKEEENLFA